MGFAIRRQITLCCVWNW